MRTFRILPVCSALSLLVAVGCSGSGGGGSSGGAQPTERVATTLPMALQVPLSLSAGVPATRAVHFEVPPGFEWGVLTGGTFDLAATLAQLTVVRTDGGANPAAPSLTVSLRVAAGDDVAGGCGGGVEAFGAVVTGDAAFGSLQVLPAEMAVPRAALDLVNGRSFTLCASATSSVDADLTLGGLAVSFGFDSGCAAPANDLAGRWTGDYACNNLCQGSPGNEAGSVVITVIQAGETAVYSDDGGAVYIGSVCESAFRHLGFGGSYFEHGTFTRTGPNTATKSSTWVSTVTPQCGGTCADTLTLSPL